MQPFAYGSKNFTGSVTYAQLLSKLRPSPQNGGEVWGGGNAPSPGK